MDSNPQKCQSEDALKAIREAEFKKLPLVVREIIDQMKLGVVVSMKLMRELLSSTETWFVGYLWAVQDNRLPDIKKIAKRHTHFQTYLDAGGKIPELKGYWISSPAPGSKVPTVHTESGELVNVADDTATPQPESVVTPPAPSNEEDHELSGPQGPVVQTHNINDVPPGGQVNVNVPPQPPAAPPPSGNSGNGPGFFGGVLATLLVVLIVAIVAFKPSVQISWNSNGDQRVPSSTAAPVVPSATAMATSAPVATDAPTTDPGSAIPTNALSSSAPVADIWATDTGIMPSLPSTIVNGNHNGHWTIQAVSDNVGDNPAIAGWLKRLKDPAPELWKTFPNVPNKDVPGFRVVNGDQVPDGMEYGMAESPFCENNPCDFVVPAREYRLITADYSFQGMVCRQSDGNGGCLLLILNEGDESYIWRDQVADNGFTVHGRYWNGDALEWGVWGLVSHASANMLNMPTSAHPGESLNFGTGTNGGANCGVPEGCNSVNVTIVVTTGDRIVAVAQTTVSRP